MSRRKSRRIILAVMLLDFFALRHSCWAQDTEKLGILVLPSFFYMPETGFGGGGLCLVTRIHPAGEDGLAHTPRPTKITYRRYARFPDHADERKLSRFPGFPEIVWSQSGF